MDETQREAAARYSPMRAALAFAMTEECINRDWRGAVSSFFASMIQEKP